jgi:hypothetical protein
MKAPLIALGVLALVLTAPAGAQANPQALFKLFDRLGATAVGDVQEAMKAARGLVVQGIETVKRLPQTRNTGLLDLVTRVLTQRMTRLLKTADEKMMPVGKDLFQQLEKAVGDALGVARTGAQTVLARLRKPIQFFGFFRTLREAMAKGWELVTGIASGATRPRKGMMKGHWQGYRQPLRAALQRFIEWAEPLGLEAVRNALYEAILAADEASETSVP